MESAQEMILARALGTGSSENYFRQKSVKAVSLQGLPAPLQPVGPVDVNRVVHCVFLLSCR